MGRKYRSWQSLCDARPRDFGELKSLVLENRNYEPMERLEYGDHGLKDACEAVITAIRENRRIALYADYDVDGTMSCVSWIWFLQAIGFENFVHYIPCRFREGYGLNMDAVRHLVDDEKADLIITMDTGITANEEAAFCRERGVTFLCTDHHLVQPDLMPDCIILNPKFHPDDRYQDLCGCGITFVLLRRLAAEFPIPQALWTDLLALVGMATICDVVPLGGVNHKLARMGVDALRASRRPVLQRLLQASKVEVVAKKGATGVDEKDVGFRLGPRINAVGRLEHADKVIDAFVHEDPEPLIRFMGECNERRKAIQKQIVAEACEAAKAYENDPILFLGGDWHPGVVGIAASKLVEMFWRPVWLFHRGEDVSKGSARSIEGFDVTGAMLAQKDLFRKCGGHRAAGGFTFSSENESALRQALVAAADDVRRDQPHLWHSRIVFDAEIDSELVGLPLMDALDDLKPFGHGFEEPRFVIESELLGCRFYQDKATGEPKHTAAMIRGAGGRVQKVLFFNEVLHELEQAQSARFVVSAGRDHFRGETKLSLFGHDFEVLDEIQC